MFKRRHAVAAACAACLAVAGASATGAGAEDGADRGSAELDVLERPVERFERSITAHLGRVAERRARREARRERVRARRERRQERRQQELADAAAPAGTLESIAACESGGDPAAVNPAGYYGKYQFDLGTWQSVGGAGNPAEAPEAEQDYRAALLYARAGASPWPVCGS